MTNKEFRVKEYLERARVLNTAIETYRMRLEEERLIIPRSTSIIKFTKVKGAKRNTDEERLMRYLERAEKIEKKIDALEKEKEQISETIEMVKDIKLKTVLIKRYLLSMSWEEVAKQMHYDRRWVTELHLRAIKELVKLNVIHP